MTAWLVTILERWAGRRWPLVVPKVWTAVVQGRPDVMPASGWIILLVATAALLVIGLWLAVKHRWLRRAAYLWPLGFVIAIAYASSGDEMRFGYRPGEYFQTVSYPYVLWPSIAVGVVLALTSGSLLMESRTLRGTVRLLPMLLAALAGLALAFSSITHGVPIR